MSSSPWICFSPSHSKNGPACIIKQVIDATANGFPQWLYDFISLQQLLMMTSLCLCLCLHISPLSVTLCKAPTSCHRCWEKPYYYVMAVSSLPKHDLQATTHASHAANHHCWVCSLEMGKTNFLVGRSSHHSGCCRCSSWNWFDLCLCTSSYLDLPLGCNKGPDQQEQQQQQNPRQLLLLLLLL